MRGRREERIEAVVDRAAAAIAAAAVAFSLFKLLGAMFPRLQLAIVIAAAATTYLLTSRALRSIQPERPALAMPGFAVRPFDLEDPEELLLLDQVELLLTDQVELVLTDADRLRPLKTPAEELVLDDILAELNPDSRVVRLFDRAAMPTPGQLNEQIERHLREPSTQAPGDASEALYQALSELRRSLR